jgi:hypothetical protein
MTQPTHEYQAAYAQGLADGRTVAQPVNTGGNTLDSFIAIKARYRDALFVRHPDDAQRGYCDGFDAAATEAGYGEPTDDQVDRFYLD